VSSPTLPGLPPTPQDFDRELKELAVKKGKVALAIQEKEFAQKSYWWAQWNNPVVLAILAGLIGLVGTLATWWLAKNAEGLRAKETLELEKTKEQGTLILDALRTGEGPDHSQQAAANLLLLADAKLVPFDDDALNKLKKWAGNVGPGLPSPVKPSVFEPLDFGSDDYSGTSRGKAKTSIADGPLKTYESLGDLLGDLPPDEKMLNLSPPLKNDFDFDRVSEEKRNVSISGWLYAAKKEHDNDFHLVVGTDPNKEPIRYMTMEITGLPPREPERTRLRAPRETFKRYLRNHQVQGISLAYLRFEPPVPVRITGSLFYDIDHAPGVVGPGSLKPRTSWEIHPITEIVFEQ
jgi:hypothetical protein